MFISTDLNHKSLKEALKSSLKMRDRLPLRIPAIYGVTNTIKELDHEPNKRNCKLTLRVTENSCMNRIKIFLKFSYVKLYPKSRRMFRSLINRFYDKRLNVRLLKANY